jgi:hypothetical protein
MLAAAALAVIFLKVSVFAAAEAFVLAVSFSVSATAFGCFPTYFAPSFLGPRKTKP